ncbi:MAG: 50S ribosomal protein L2 [Elusimicrobia bacterium]|nr:50S ribosomal protein L2 [Elusimicrobiota bacterium]
MALKTFKPYTPSRRSMSVEDFSWLSKKAPEKKLLRALPKTGGRNNTGQIMVRHIGGRHQRRYRLIDFKRDNWGVPGRVVSVEYDPNRTSRIALVYFSNGDKRYIIHAEGLKVNDRVMSGPEAEIKIGNALPLSAMPEGSVIHNIELVPGKGGQIVRSAGGAAQLMAKEREFCQVRLPSGEIRLIPSSCTATIGQVGNLEHENLSLGNAGRSRHRGIRPTVRGTAMNSVDHPHGGGRGRSKGNNQPRSPWNQPAKGYKTRTRHQTDWLIVRDRRASKAVVSAA